MIWENLGYKRNIYFIEPLSIDDLGTSLLCGRDNEISQFIDDCFSDNKCLKVIGGDVGIGKTSFVNACQFICYKPKGFKLASSYLNKKILPSYKKVELSDRDDINSFSLKSVISLTTNINTHFMNTGEKIPHSIKDYIDYWTKVRLKTSSGGLGVQVASFGMSYTSNTYESQEMRDPLTAFYQLLNNILDETDLSGVFMLLDNIDTFKREINLVRILDEIRDSFFTSDNIYWILVGQKGLGQLISSQSRRLGGYLTGQEITLQKLQPKVFLYAIEKREKSLRLSNESDLKTFRENRKKIAKSKKGKLDVDYTIYPPLDDTTHTMIYEFTHFELRETFKICSDTTIRAQEYVKANGQLLSEHAFNYLIEYSDKMTSTIYDINHYKGFLSKIYRKREVSNSEYKKYGYKTASGFESVLRKFAHKGLLLSRTKDKIKLYEASWIVEAMALCNLLDEGCNQLAYAKYSDLLTN